MITQTNTYNPDYTVHPGEILNETLEARNIKKSELAERCGLSVKTISQILNGKAPITAETAIQLERALGVSADIWNNLDANYRLSEAKRQEKHLLEKYKNWVARFPLAELRKRGILPQTKDISITAEALLVFFGVSSSGAWDGVYKKITVSYRKSNKFKDSIPAIVSWLRIGIIQAEEIDTRPYDKNTFIRNLQILRGLTDEDPSVFELKMRRLCQESGVALVFVSELPGTHLSGATMWLSKDKALIIMSLRHKSDDHFWFTLFHEAGHIILHGKKEIFIDETKMEGNREEAEADKFAQDILIPEIEYKKFISQNKGSFYENNIKQFAKSMKVAPGVVVGRLQYDKLLSYRFQNKLKKKFVLVEDMDL